MITSAATTPPSTTTQITNSLKIEINTNPDKLGYSGKTAQQIADLINTPIDTQQTITRDVTDPDTKKVTTQTLVVSISQTVPVFRVINGIVSAPNMTTSAQVSTATAAV